MDKNDESKSFETTILKDMWMVRPCDVYLDEYNECKSLKGKFHQQYTSGSVRDCSKWKQDFNNCLLFRETLEDKFAESIIINEKERREERLKNAKNNDIWEYRTTPPSDWNKPLPDTLQRHSVPRDNRVKSGCSIS